MKVDLNALKRIAYASAWEPEQYPDSLLKRVLDELEAARDVVKGARVICDDNSPYLKSLIAIYDEKVR